MDQLRFETVCKQLRLPHILQILTTQDLEMTVETKEDWLMCLLEKELACREKLKITRLLKQAKLPINRTLDNYEWHEHICLPSVTTKEELLSLSFIRQKENAVFVGTPGTGKTHLACALGKLATQSGIETRFWRVSELVGELERQWKNNTLEVFKHRFDKVKLVILDEMGYVPFTKEGAELLFRTAALVDRLIHHAHILSFTGESFRLKNALSKSN